METTVVVNNRDEKVMTIKVLLYFIFFVLLSLLITFTIILIPQFVDHRTSQITAECLHGFLLPLNKSSNDHHCECFKGFTKSHGQYKCEYEQKLWLAACILQTLPWTGIFGVGMFYINSFIGPLQLTYTILAIFCSCFSCRFEDRKCQISRRIGQDYNNRLLVYICVILRLLFWIISCLILWLNLLPDGRGQPLYVD